MLGAVPRPIPGAGSPSSALSMDLGVTRGGGSHWERRGAWGGVGSAAPQAPLCTLA